MLIQYFTILAEIVARSLAKFHFQHGNRLKTDTRIYNLYDASSSESRQFDNLLF